MFPLLTLQPRDVDLSKIDPDEHQQVRDIVTKLFTAWQAQTAHVGDRSTEVPLKADVIRRTEGRSGVEVYDLRFSRKLDPSNQASRFIIRCHRGEAGNEGAKQEKMRAQLLSNTGTEIFSSRLLPLPLPNVVAYWHAGGELGQEELESLSAAMERALGERDQNAGIRLRDALERMSKELALPSRL